MGAVIGALADLGYGLAWRVLGNAVPPPMIEWIARRIAATEAARPERRAA